MKEKLDKLVRKYETEDFIKDDPVQFPHRYQNKEDIEISGFISALFAFGNREVFIKKLKILFSIMQNRPYGFILEYPKKSESLNGFIYRFVKDEDLKSLLSGLNTLYTKDNSSLEEIFSKGTQSVCNYFKGVCKNNSLGFCHLLSDPKNGGAQKRYNMLLRWMIRKSPVDLGIWNFMDKKDLLIPLDVHVARVSRELGLLKRKSNDFKAVLELTEKLRKFDPNDPVKYDFALFGFGVENKNNNEIKK